MCSFDASLMSTIPTKHCGSSVQCGQNISPPSRGTSPSASVLPSPKERRVVVPGIGTAVQVSCIETLSQFLSLIILLYVQASKLHLLPVTGFRTVSHITVTP
jgi:hypothetical protein